MEIWDPKPPRTLWATPGLLREAFSFTALLKDIIAEASYICLQYFFNFILLACR